MAVDHERILNTLGKMGYYLETHHCVCVSVSGGSDSDIIVHMIATHFREHLHKVHFVFANTGIEYQATLRHLSDLEAKYGIEIRRLGIKDGVMPIPLAVRKYGVPFVSKQVSEYAGRLQQHGFDWSDGTLEELCTRFPNTRAAMRWWCNDWGSASRFNIKWNVMLKEFLEQEKPKTKFSAICCQKSKKEPLIRFQKSIGADLLITGERKSEGGARAGKSSCFERTHDIDHYMPLFFWNDGTKAYYKESENIVYSDCYEVYGMRRTGCVGCPFGQRLNEELAVMLKYEPKLHGACVSVFGESYALTERFLAFKEAKRNAD